MRADLRRLAIYAQEKSGFDFDSVYNFLFKVCKENKWSVGVLWEKIEVTPGKIYIDWKNQMFRMSERATHGMLKLENNDGADYWERRILARQEAIWHD